MSCDANAHIVVVARMRRKRANSSTRLHAVRSHSFWSSKNHLWALVVQIPALEIQYVEVTKASVALLPRPLGTSAFRKRRHRSERPAQLQKSGAVLRAPHSLGGALAHRCKCTSGASQAVVLDVCSCTGASRMSSTAARRGLHLIYILVSIAAHAHRFCPWRPKLRELCSRTSILQPLWHPRATASRSQSARPRCAACPSARTLRSAPLLSRPAFRACAHT